MCIYYMIKYAHPYKPVKGQEENKMKILYIYSKLKLI